MFNTEGRVVGVAFAGLDEADNIGHASTATATATTITMNAPKPIPHHHNPITFAFTLVLTQFGWDETKHTGSPTRRAPPHARYVIPMSVVRLFLRTYEDSGSFGQLPSLGVTFQSTENPSLRRMLRLDESSRVGLLVVSLAPLMPAARLLSPGDVVTKLDGLEIAEDGSVQAMGELRLPWEYLITRRPSGEAIEIEYVRDGRTSSGQLQLVPEPRLVPYHDRVDASAEYVIVGGLVFLELSLPLVDAGFFETMSEPMASGYILSRIGARRKQPDQSIVILACVLESELTISYEASCVGKVLTKINNEGVRNLKTLASTIYASSSKPFLHFQFDEPGHMAVIETALSKKMEAEVLGAHDIATWCSRNVDPRGDKAMLGCITAFSALRGKS